MKQFYKNLWFIILLFCSTVVGAQNINDTIEVHRNPSGKINFARFKTNPDNKMQNTQAFLKNILQLKQDDELRLIKQTTDELGISHNKYQQYYKGIKVEHAEFSVHNKSGIIEIINGEINDINIASVKPSVAEKDALTKALSFVNAKKYKWEDVASESFIKQNTNNRNATYYPKGELVIQKDYLHNEKDFKLAWKFTISSLEPFNEQLIYVDANNGYIIANIPLIIEDNVACTAQTKYSGNQAITGDTYTGGNRLREVRNGVNVQTLNLHGSYVYGTATDFSNNNTNWANGSWTTFNQDQQALDAHWGAERVLDYWRIIFNRNSINGAALPVISYVHNPIGDNAYWDGTNNVMNYGDGGSQFRPLTALDVCAHEFGHGICQFTANLIYHGESGALNEGFSDIWGASVEQWAAPNKQEWLIGEEIMLNAAALRSLQNPNQFSQPDTYLGTYWASTAGGDNGGVHTNSGVLNYWYYLVSQGGSGTNDIGHAFTVSGIGIDNAQRIAFRAESVYLVPASVYADARTATIQAARDLYGIGSCDEKAVTDAWYAVGIGNPLNNITISGPSAICYNSTVTYTLSNVPNGAAVVWSASDAYRTVTPAANGLSAQVKNISTTSVPSTIRATVSPCIGGIANITLGAPYIAGSYTNTYDNSNNPLGFYPGVTNPACTGYYINTNMEITGASGLPNVTWSKVSSTGVVNYTQTGNDIRFYLFADNQNVVFQLSAQDGCGTTIKQFKWQSSACSGGGGGGNCFAFDVSPNPTDGDANIDVTTIIPPCNIEGIGTQQDVNNLLITEVKVYDVAQHLRKNERISGTKHFRLNLSGLTNGVYYLKITGNNGHKEHRIIYKK